MTNGIDSINSLDQSETVLKPGYPHHGIFVRTMYLVEWHRIKSKLRKCRVLALKIPEAA